MLYSPNSSMDESTNTNRRFTTENLREAGASEVFISLYLSSFDGRHSVKEELNQGYGGDVLARDDDPSEVGGHFFKKLWDGDVFEALMRADGNNTKLMSEVFGGAGIFHAAIQNGADPDYAERIIEERLNIEL